MEALEQLIEQRVAKLEAVRKTGADPYQTPFQRDGSIREFLEPFKEGRKVRAAGRLTALRGQGKIAFGDLHDQSGKIQLFFSEEFLKERYAQVKETLDLGDIVGIEGECFKSKTGEPTIRVERWALLSKALRPPPEKFHGLQNQETKYRKRYLDLMANPETRATFELRSKLTAGIRRFLDGKGFIEVETPMMQLIPGGAAGKPFKTHHNALGLDLFLRIAPELYLKRLLVGGFDKVYELNRNFRNEGLSTRHNPEFTMLEVYESYGSCASMMELTEEMVTSLAQGLKGTAELDFGGKKIDLKRPWKRVSLAELLKKECGVSPTDPIDKMAEKLLARKGHKGTLEDGRGQKKVSRMQIANIVLDLLDEIPVTEAGAPTFVTEFFEIFSPLAKSLPGKPGVADRFELYIGGMEIANAYTELNDPIEQKKRFESYKEIGGEEAKTVDMDFVEALEYGMPPAGGLGIGIDRLAMLLTGKETIRDVILFPTLKPDTQ